MGNRPTVVLPPVGHYVIEPLPDTVVFATTHAFGAPVRGTFALLDGQVDVADDVTATTMSVRIDAGSVDTGLKVRDVQLRSSRFLATKRFPELTFESASITAGGDEWRIAGRLSAVGRVVETTLLLTSVEANSAGFSATATAQIDTRDFGLPSVPGFLGRRLACTFTVSARRVPA